MRLGKNFTTMFTVSLLFGFTSYAFASGSDHAFQTSGPNIALKKVASQSSRSEWSTPTDPQGAVDGIKNGNFGFHTNEELNPWWQVDLGANYKLDWVVLNNREDCCSDRARTVQVLVSTDGVNFKKMYEHDGGNFGGVTSGAPLFVALSHSVGRYIRLQLNEVNSFHLDEVEVFGTMSSASPAINKSATQWVPFNGTIPANAVVGGSENGMPMYVGRMAFQGGQHPGKIISGKFCNIGWGGKEYSFDKGFEVLTAPANSLTWVEYTGAVPTNAIFGGFNDEAGREPLYIAKHEYNGGVHCGKLWANACNIGWGGKEIVLNQKIYVLATAPTKFKSTGQKGSYTSWVEKWELPTAGKSAVVFTAVAANDIHIAFSGAAKTLDPMYEIVIGGWGNTKTAVRRKSQGPGIAEKLGGIRKPGVADQYWMMVDKDTKTISAGFGPYVGQNVVIETKDPNFLSNVKYVAFSSWNTPIEFWDVNTYSMEGGQ